MFQMLKFPFLIIMVIAFNATANMNPRIEDLVKGALKDNLDLGAAIEKIRASEEKVNAARAAYYPSANYSYSVNRHEVSAGDQWIHAQTSQQSSIELSWTIWDNGRRALNMELAKFDRNKKELALVVLRQKLILNTLEIYGLWASHYLWIGNLGSYVRLIDVVLEIDKKSPDTLSPVEIDRLRSKKMDLERKLKLAKEAAEKIGLELEDLTGIRVNTYGEQNWVLREESLSFLKQMILEQELPSIDKSLDLFRLNNLEIRSLNLQQENITQMLEGKNAPDIQAGVTLSLNSKSNQDGPSHQSSHGSDRSVRFFIQGKFDLGSNSRTRAASHEGEADRLGLENKKRLLERALGTKHGSLMALINKYKDNMAEIQRSSLANSTFEIKSSEELKRFIAHIDKIEAVASETIKPTQILYKDILNFLSQIYVLEEYFKIRSR